LSERALRLVRRKQTNQRNQGISENVQYRNREASERNADSGNGNSVVCDSGRSSLEECNDPRSLRDSRYSLDSGYPEPKVGCISSVLNPATRCSGRTLNRSDCIKLKVGVRNSKRSKDVSADGDRVSKKNPKTDKADNREDDRITNERKLKIDVNKTREEGINKGSEINKGSRFANNGMVDKDGWLSLDDELSNYNSRLPKLQVLHPQSLDITPSPLDTSDSYPPCFDVNALSAHYNETSLDASAMVVCCCQHPLDTSRMAVGCCPPQLDVSNLRIGCYPQLKNARSRPKQRSQSVKVSKRSRVLENSRESHRDTYAGGAHIMHGPTIVTPTDATRECARMNMDMDRISVESCVKKNTIEKRNSIKRHEKNDPINEKEMPRSFKTRDTDKASARSKPIGYIHARFAQLAGRMRNALNSGSPRVELENRLSPTFLVGMIPTVTVSPSQVIVNQLADVNPGGSDQSEYSRRKGKSRHVSANEKKCFQPVKENTQFLSVGRSGSIVEDGVTKRQRLSSGDRLGENISSVILDVRQYPSSPLTIVPNRAGPLTAQNSISRLIRRLSHKHMRPPPHPNVHSK